MNLAGATVIVADDNAELAENIADILEAEGARVLVAATCKELLELAAREAFDVALVDTLLPDGAGAGLLTELQRRGGGAEVVLLAGNASLHEAMEALSRGAYAYAVKPLDPVMLVADVFRAVRQVRSTRDSEALEQALERSEAGLGALVNTVHALLLVLDEEGKILQANQAAAEAARKAISDLEGARWLDLFVDEDERELAAQSFERLVVSGAPMVLQSRVSERGSTRPVDTRWVRWRAGAIRDEDGRARVYLSGLDMSDTRELERRARLTEKLAAVGTLSAGLAHEIRNPLNAAGLQLRLLNRRLDAAEAGSNLKEPVSLVQAELGRLSRLVGEFLQFARPTGLVRSRVDVADLARAVVELEAPAAMEKGARITARLPSAPALVEGDAEKLRQVVLNLIRNAVEASGKDGRVEVGVEPWAEGFLVQVSDDGPGIPEEDLPRIFEPFYSTKPGGTGLGMSIVHSLVTLHGGDVSVDSRQGGGTRVTVSLPKVAPLPDRPR